MSKLPSLSVSQRTSTKRRLDDVSDHALTGGMTETSVSQNQVFPLGALPSTLPSFMFGDNSPENPIPSMATQSPPIISSSGNIYLANPVYSNGHFPMQYKADGKYAEEDVQQPSTSEVQPDSTDNSLFDLWADVPLNFG